MSSNTQVYISGRITDCGPDNLGGDGSIGFFQRALEKRGYQVFSQELGLSLGGSKGQGACEAAISACQIVVVLVTQDLGKTGRNMKELRSAVTSGKTVIPIWHSGTEYPPPGTADLLKAPKLPATSKPFVESSHEETLEELVMRLQMKGCYPTKGHSSSNVDLLLASELSQKLAVNPILMSRESGSDGRSNSVGGGYSGNSSSKLFMRKDSSQLGISSAVNGNYGRSGSSIHEVESDSGSVGHMDTPNRTNTPTLPACVAPTIGSGEWHVFLSHYQANAGNTVFSLKLILEQACPGLKLWYDNDQDPSEAGMQNGVGNSRHYLLYQTLGFNPSAHRPRSSHRQNAKLCVPSTARYYLLYLTLGCLTRPAVQYEARTALRIGKPIVLVKETDPRFGAAVNFDEYIKESPDDLKAIFGLATAIPWFRDKEFRDARLCKETEPIESSNQAPD
eukprot:gene24784-10426_t